jgi:hypothetical protein
MQMRRSGADEICPFSETQRTPLPSKVRLGRGIFFQCIEERP